MSLFKQTRRQMLVVMTTAGAAAATGAAAMQGAGYAPALDTQRADMIRVIEELEAWQGWEASSVVATKAFAAWQMRKAMGLDLSGSEHAQMHVDYQHQSFERYKRSYLFEMDSAAGKNCEINAMERALG